MVLDAATTRRPTNVKADSTVTITLDSTNSRLLFESTTSLEPHVTTITAAEQIEDRFLKRIRSDGTEVWYALHPFEKVWVEIDSEQRWFWTEEWQASERKIDEELANGDYQDFDNIDDFFDAP